MYFLVAQSQFLTILCPAVGTLHWSVRKPVGPARPSSEERKRTFQMLWLCMGRGGLRMGRGVLCECELERGVL